MHDSLELLKMYAPTLFDCSTRNKGTEKSVIKKYDERWTCMENAIATHGVFSAKTCIFDLLWKASKDADAEAFLKFVDLTACNALSYTKGSTRQQIEKVIIKMLTSFGEESSEYKNHFAEIAAIAKLVEKGVELFTVEKELQNGKRIDFEVSMDGVIVLLEIYNIDFDIDRIQKSEDLKIFLENRLIKKIEEKFVGIDRLGMKPLLVPVLWGDIMFLVHFREAFDYFKQFAIIGPFMMVAYYKNSIDGRSVYDFGTVEQFLLRVERRKTTAF